MLCQDLAWFLIFGQRVLHYFVDNALEFLGIEVLLCQGSIRLAGLC